MAMSGLQYASSIWDPSAQFEINSLEKAQHRAARFVTHQWAIDVSMKAEILKNLKWDTLQTRQTATKLIMLYKLGNSW